MMLLPDGSSRPAPSYLQKPQSEWSAAECEAHGKLQEEILEMQRSRAAHNPRQQLIPAGQEATATELVAQAGENVPALISAVGTIARRFEQFVDNIHQLNLAIGQFKNDVVVPFKKELEYLRYTTGDRLNHVSTDLEKYVAQLDSVMWSALRASGMSDDAIRQYRTTHGMTPETPRGFELSAHLAELEELRRSNAELIDQNRRLLAFADGHAFGPGETTWQLKEGCTCGVCKAQREVIATTLTELESISQQENTNGS